jgi:hypothetical protein
MVVLLQLNLRHDNRAGIDDGTDKVGMNDLYDQIEGRARRIELQKRRPGDKADPRRIAEFMDAVGREAGIFAGGACG